MSGSIDPRIPLQAGQPSQNIGPDLGKVFSMAEMAQKMQQQNQQMQSQNALRQLLGQPGAIDPKTGFPTAATMTSAYGIDPGSAVQLQGNALKAQEAASLMGERQSLMQEHQAAAIDRYRKLSLPTQQAAVEAYDTTFKQTGSVEQANKAAQVQLDNGRRDLEKGGLIPPQYIQNGNWNASDPGMIERMRAALGPDYARQQHQNAADARQEKRLDEQHWQLVYDSDGTAFRYNPATGAAKQAVGDEPYYPKNITKPGAKTADPTPIPDELADTHGEDYLKTLKPAEAAQVKAIIEGRMAFPGGYSMKDNYWKTVLRDVAQVDPNFDATNYNTRYKARQDASSGATAKNITSFNTAIGHLGRLADAATKLDNGDYPFLNRIKNTASTLAGHSAVNDFNLAKQAVASELTRAFRGTGGTLEEIKDWQSRLDAAMSPEQVKGAVGEAVQLLRSRIDAVGDTYNRAMNVQSGVTEFLSPEARRTLARLEGGETGSGENKDPEVPEQPAPAAAPAAAPALPQQALAALTEGHVTTFGNGQKWTLRGGKPVQVQ